MGLRCEYFTAPDDGAAAATIDWIGGPSRPPVGADGYPTLEIPGVEPTVMMGSLDELLTGRSFDEVLADPTGRRVASRDGGAAFVRALPTAFQDALSATNDARLLQMAVPWIGTEEFAGQGDAGLAGDALIRLAALVRDGRRREHALYCWFSL